jgi:hypothetical protein
MENGRMADIVRIPIADLLLDTANPRLPGEHTTQQEAALNLAKQQGDNIVRLAKDIVEHGMDPTSLPAVVATDDQRKSYRVIEGNRRILAVRALETPSLISPVLSAGAVKRLNELSAKYAQNAQTSIECALFDSEEDAQHWIILRHTGANEGVGLVGWGSEEQDRFKERHAGVRRPAGQILDFVEKQGDLSEAAQQSKQKVLTTLDRLIKTPYAREKLGVEVVDGQVVSLHPADKVAAGLTKVVEDLKTGVVGVPDLYKVNDRVRYIDGLPTTALPKKSTKVDNPIVLADVAAGKSKPRTVPKTRKPKGKREAPRTTVIPKATALNVGQPRINKIYNELLGLSAEQYPNACSVLLRVFIELSVDHVIESRNLMTDDQMRNAPLAKRLKKVAGQLAKDGKIPSKLKQAVERVADGSHSILGASVPTFNQYVHNEYVYPRPAELYTTWDELAPFMKKVWP